MLIAELANYIRKELLDDNVSPFLWDNNYLLSLINRAELEACKRASLLNIDITIPVVKDTDTYTISSNINSLYSIKFAADFLFLIQIFKQNRYDYSRELKGSPRYYIYNMDDTVTLLPIPDKSYTLIASIDTLPINQSKGMTDTLEIPNKYAYELGNYVAGESFLKPDIDTQDLRKAQLFMEKFSQTFGVPVTVTDTINRKIMPKEANIKSGKSQFGFY